MVINYVAFNLVLAAILLWGRYEARRFLSAYSTIDSDSALEAFKILARRNMVVALIYLPIGLTSFLWSVYLVAKSYLIGLTVVLTVQISLFLLGRSLKKLEVRARCLESNDAAFKQEHQRVSESWVKKALPDF
jgi:hypothetical protein